MTSALQLLYIWRSPYRRNQVPVAALETDHPDPEPDVRRSRRDGHHGRHVRRGAEGDPSRRSHGGATKDRHPKSCGSHKELELGRSSRNGSDGYWPGNNSNGGVSNSTLTRLGLTRNDQLPGAVQEARKRLLERLRSVSLAESRERAPENDVLNVESALCDNHANILNGGSPVQRQHSSSFHIANKKKIPVFIWDAFCTLKGENFRSSEEKLYEGGVKGAVTECCICLEGFKDGDWLIKLCCRHKFHPACLEPWVRSSGDCPLCRADII